MGHPLLDLTNKIAVVIGGTSGIGLALTKGLAQAGADVVPTGRSASLVTAAVSEVRALGRRSLVHCDVTDNASLEALLRARVRTSAVSRYLRTVRDALTKRKPTFELPDSEWDAIMETNFTGTLRACRIFGQ